MTIHRRRRVAEITVPVAVPPTVPQRLLSKARLLYVGGACIDREAGNGAQQRQTTLQTRPLGERRRAVPELNKSQFDRAS